MAMLAEKKRREKWSLNPRGKVWSDDQNKFGQKLLEKMGWKAGEGLGAKSQGITDIVKTRVKNDSKGLGFKENGEEWLKTTSEFDSLLDELASSQAEDGGESQTESPVSLEDRSKKSRARVHYHKFTRGKDLSRYSEKDLASIIGPDVLKSKSEQDTTPTDYTQNQINKGSIEEYFNKKSKSKGKKSTDGNTCSHEEEDNINCEESNATRINENKEILQNDLNSDSKNKRKRKNTGMDENEADVKTSDFDAPNCEAEKLDLVTEPSSKKKKKRKTTTGLEDNLQELVENIFSDQEYKTNTELHNHDDVSQSKASRKRKNKEINNMPGGNTSDNVGNSMHDADDNEENVQKKKQRKVKNELIEESANTEEAVVDEQIECRKKKKKSKVKSESQNYEDIEQSVELEENNAVVAVDSKSKKKKSKSKRVEVPEDSLEDRTQHDLINSEAIGESYGIEETVPKKKKKKSKVVDKESEEHGFEDVPIEENKKTKDSKIELDIEKEQNSTECGDEQVSSSNNNVEFIEVLGRTTRLKKIKPLPKTTTNDSYKTDEFMSFSNTDSSGLSAPKDVNQNCLVSKQQQVFNEEENTNVKVTKERKSKTKKKLKNLKKTIISEDSSYVKCYVDPASDDKNLPKHVVAYEYRLIAARLKALKITPPDVKVVILKESNLNETTHRKLKQLEKIKHLKTLLPPNDVSEIETQVSKFHESLKPKIELMTTISELEEKIIEIGKTLEGNSIPKSNQNESTVVETELSKETDFLTSLFKKIESLVEVFQKDDSNCNTARDSKEKSLDDPADGNESRCVWLKKVENKLITLKKYMNMLSDGEKLPCINPTEESQNSTKKKKKQYPKANAYANKYQDSSYTRGKIAYNVRTANDYTNSYQDSSYTRGKIAHNVRTQRGRGRGVGRIQTVSQNAVPYGGWGILKSYGTGEEEQRSEGQNYGGEFEDESYTGQGSSTRQARCFNSRGALRGRRGAINGRGRGDFMEHGRSDFMGSGRSLFVGRGRGGFRARGRADVRGRGRISQNNFDAKLYAEQCKEQNKVPSVCFNGINLKFISGYAAKAIPSNSEAKSPAVSKTVPNK